MRDVFDLQDHIVASIVGAISPSVYAAEIERARLKRPGSLQAYDYALRAYPGLWSVADPGHEQALRLLHKAIELEPDYAMAMAQAAWGHAQRFNRAMAGDPESDRRQAIELANAALALAPDDPEVLSASSHALLITGTSEMAERCAALARKALTLNPSLSRGWRHLGYLHIFRSDPSQAIDAFERSIRLSPLDPMALHSWGGIGDAQFLSGRLQEALSVYQQCLAEKPRDQTFKRRVCSLLALTGNLEDAQRVARELLTDHPHLTLDRIASASRLEAPHRERYLEGLRRAGFT
jgi:adenylate cyclase